MKRRTYIGGIMGSLLGLSGCLSESVLQSSGETNNGPVTNSEFIIVDSGKAENNSRFPPAPSAGPVVKFNQNSDQVTVTGSVLVGSSECKKAILESITYEDETDTVQIEITDGDKDNNNSGCTDDASMDFYKLEISFESKFSGNITVTETNFMGETATTSLGTNNSEDSP